MSLTLTEATDPDRDGDSAQVEAEPVAPEPTFLGRVSAGTDRLFRMRRGSAGAKRASAPFLPDRRRMSAAEVSWLGLGLGLVAKFTRHARVQPSPLTHRASPTAPHPPPLAPRPSPQIPCTLPLAPRPRSGRARANDQCVSLGAALAAFLVRLPAGRGRRGRHHVAPHVGSGGARAPREWRLRAAPPCFRRRLVAARKRGWGRR